jgi:small GTP-binding protein
MQDHWIREGKGFVVVYASNNKESFNEVNQIRKRIERVKNSKDFPMILVANKYDLETNRKVDRDMGEEMAKDFSCPFIETSAKTGYNCTEVFMELVREIRKREDVGKQPKKPKSKLKEFFSSCTLI